MRKIKVVVLLVQQLQHGFTKNAKVSPNLTVAHISVFKVKVICASNNCLTQCTCNGLTVNGRYWDANFDLQSKVCDVTFRWSLLVTCQLILRELSADGRASCGRRYVS